MSERSTRYPRREGLILLVVLGMLSLFSLLAVTYVVVSSQSRAANTAMVRRDFRGTPPAKLLDSALRIALRGTTDPASSLWHHDLLGDLYGSIEPPVQLRVRRTEWSGNTGAGLNTAIPPNPPPPAGWAPPLTPVHPERPLLLEGRFLRIPIVRNALAANQEFPSSNPANANAYLPVEHDVWTGRIVTFLDGPLRGHSLRVIRYVGDTRNAVDGSGNPNMDQRIQTFSIVIDLQDLPNEVVHVGGTTRSLREWIEATPAGPDQRGLYLCYQFDAQNSIQAGYRVLLNAAPFNAHGVGIRSDLSNVSQNHSLPTPLDTAGISTFPVNLQPNYGRLGAGGLEGDTDESYDAADYNNFWLSHRASGATSSEDIIPSFHRPALINYIANWKDPSTFVNFEELAATVLRIERAAARPLAYRVINGTNSGTPDLVSNLSFSGSNLGDYANGREPILDCVFDNNWASSPNGVQAFQNWVRWLTLGPWDVDSDADGIFDGIWVDPNMPLITSPEGKLLKVLVSYTIESLDSRLDVNAAGNLTQADANFTTQTNASYVVGAGNYLPQGLGLGPADIALRHLFPNDNAYLQFLFERYGGVNFHAGAEGNDLRSRLNEREFLKNTMASSLPRHPLLPAFSLSVNGRQAIGLDHLGNPLVLNANPLNIGGPMTQFDDEAYEARWMRGAYRDAPFTLAEWERLLRRNDWDRSNLPRRLDGLALVHRSIVPRSRHLRLPSMAVPQNNDRSNSLYELLADIYAFRDLANHGVAADNAMSFAMFAELFPIELHRGQLMNLNRPLGNGVDDDGDGNVDEPEEMLQNRIDDDGDGTIDELTVAERQPPVNSTAGFTSRQRTQVISGNTMQYSNPQMVEDYTFGQGIDSGNLDPAYESLTSVADRAFHFGQQSRQLAARNLYCLAMLILPEELYLSNRPNSSPLTGDLRARAIAQWAVNVIDFRDADSAMTRFPYDPDPFVSTGGTYYWEPELNKGEVVWGHENVDVVLTESLATHDLRVKDTDRDSTGRRTTATTNPDDDFDQYRMPEGSLFLELMATRTTSDANDTSVPGVAASTFPWSLYTRVGSNVVLNLGAITPPNENGIQFPVFRIVISAPHPNSSASPLALQQPGREVERSVTTYQFSQTSASGLVWDVTNPTAPPPLDIDRVILFTQPGLLAINGQSIPDLPTGLTAAQVQGRVFENRSGRPMVLAGGQYLVVGPRQVTYFGSRNVGGTNHRPNHHRIVLEDAFTPYQPSNTQGNNAGPYRNWVTYFDGNNDRVNNRRTDSMGNPATRDCLTMIAGIPPMTWNPNPGGNSPPLLDMIGVNVSAPHVNQYYPPPTEQLDSNDNMPDPVNNAPGFALMPGDAFYDFSGGGTTPSLPDEPFDSTDRNLSPIARFWPLNGASGTPGTSDLPAPGTVEDWCTAFLQRLADPERPWHAVFNPYITVDWIPIDLTVFSGEDNIDAGSSYRFTTRQKSGAMVDVTAGGFAPQTGRTFLSYAVTNTGAYTSPTGAVTGTYFDRQLPLDTSLANPPQPDRVRPTTDTGASQHFVTLGYLNSPFRMLGQDTPQVVNGYIGAPADMPASLFWLDRPFANPLELMMVPLSAPGQLFQEFSTPAPPGSTNLYSSPQDVNDMTHLPNFFQAIDASAGNQLSPATLFELVETPSPWTDAEDWLPPDVVVRPSATTLQDVSVRELFAPLRPPYNRISCFTEPGRVNINDISEPAVWQGIIWGTLSPSQRTSILTGGALPYWNPLVVSRRGYDVGQPGFYGSNPASLPLSPDYPTRFAGVFKSPFEAGFVPDTFGGVLDQQAISNPVQTTLLRSVLNGNQPLFSPSSPYPVKHPFAEYLPITRLANLVTTRSNVFSVRVTIGFFEVDASGSLGQEYLADEGRSQRHTAFYIIDRSIPVGYQQGRDLNTEKCILMRRMIE
ncbi:MAG: hypothetical protein KatS3mg111_4272 [Pirellulaceae bacterium]|nr:MAG: hypothetical protein KatS3mg111_2103 [Pirellulaceae bacterium]GIX00940.1 MAG: hypothetical protein KatS3mg111_4272 [Pirellulaceae bacterium]